MNKLVVLFVGAAVGATAVAPAAYARHRRVHHPMMAAPMANPRMNAAGDFYATPISATGIGIPGADVIPGLGLAVGVVNGVAGPAVGVVNGVTTPILAPGGVVTAPLNAAGQVVDPLFAPLAQLTPPT